MTRIEEAKQHYLSTIKQFVPPYLMVNICQCITYNSMYNVNGVWHCSNCDKPHVWTHTFRRPNDLNGPVLTDIQYVEECDNCGKFYIVNKWPDNMLLCPSCEAL